MWWPIAPYDHLAVSTEDAGVGWHTSKVELWQCLGHDAGDHGIYGVYDDHMIII